MRKKSVLFLSTFVISATISQSAMIALEAEAYSSVSASPTFNTTLSAGASGGLAITASDDSQGATVTYALNVTTAGSYTLYVRTFSPSDQDDSFYAPTQAEFDSSGSPTVQINNLATNNTSSYRWVNTNAQSFVGETGNTSGSPAPEYTFGVGQLPFTIRAREDGLFIDALVWSTDNAISDPAILDNALTIPEPASTGLLAFGLLSLAMVRRRSRI